MWHPFLDQSESKLTFHKSLYQISPSAIEIDVDKVFHSYDAQTEGNFDVTFRSV